MDSSTLLSKAEKSYVQDGLRQSTRADGRGMEDYRAISLETGVSALANGSAKVGIGVGVDGAGGTQVVVATKLEVEDVADSDEQEGRVACTGTWYVFSILFYSTAAH